MKFVRRIEDDLALLQMKRMAVGGYLQLALIQIKKFPEVMLFAEIDVVLVQLVVMERVYFVDANLFPQLNMAISGAHGSHPLPEALFYVYRKRRERLCQ